MDKNIIIEILDNFKDKNVLVLGDIMLDKYIFGEVDRISPEAPVQVVNVRKEKFVLGGAANVCNNIASLGGKTSICGITGNDEAGKILFSILKEKAIDSSLIFQDEKKSTTQKIRVVGQSQQLLRIDYENTEVISSNIEEQIIQAIENKIEMFDVIIVSDYAKGLVTENIMNILINEGREKRKKIIIDPKPKHKDRYKGAYLITPNLKEATGMSGIYFEDDSSIPVIAEQLLQDMNSHILITCGDRGMYLLEKDGESYTLPTKAREVYDVTGAGDTVIAALSLSLSAGATLKEASYIANYAAGIVVGKAGTATTTTGEIKREVNYEQSRIS